MKVSNNNDLCSNQQHISYEIRPAHLSEVEDLYQLLKPLADNKLILPRSQDDIQRHLHRFVVAAGDKGEILGCASLSDFGNGLQEIRSLAVSPQWEGHGIGSALLRKVLRQAQQEGTTRLFALTLRPALFQRYGFEIVSMTSLPEKVWKDCAQCPKKENCDEIALLLELNPA